MNATEVYLRMHQAIVDSRYSRTVTDRASPQQQLTLEAPLGEVYRLSLDNIVWCRSLDLRWATANVVHFFAETEYGESLKRYNRLAERYITDGRFVGAYGFAFLGQVRSCIERLTRDPLTRRAVCVSPTTLSENLNRPACWTSLQFLVQDGRLHLLVHQRSLSLQVMPYDAVMLTNLLNFVAWAAQQSVGEVVWFVGSLHSMGTDKVSLRKVAIASLLLDPKLLASYTVCRAALESPESYPFPYLAEKNEVRT